MLSETTSVRARSGEGRGWTHRRPTRNRLPARCCMVLPPRSLEKVSSHSESGEGRVSIPDSIAVATRTLVIECILNAGRIGVGEVGMLIMDSWMDAGCWCSVADACEERRGGRGRRAKETNDLRACWLAARTNRCLSEWPDPLMPLTASQRGGGLSKP